MKKLTVLFAAVLMLAACGSKEETKTGTAQGTPDENGDYVIAEVTLKGDAIESVSLDAMYGGKSKKELGDDYNMKSASSIGKEWYEQIEFLEDYIAKNGIDAVEVGENGKAVNDDVLSGCTIAISDFVEVTKAAVENAE